ncbi:MAG TPA: hypothetical protein VE623_16505 [Acidimicrobiales bacterium]|nr:hypothetical protein [Acidimicrobiales bacterium]
MPAAVRRIPALAGVGIRGCWSGDYEMSPDHKRDRPGHRRAGGAPVRHQVSGHGFQQGPVVGECLADLVLGRRPELDLSPLSLDRFSQQALRPEAHVA